MAVGLRDMYHTLLHPGGKGALSHAVPSVLWRISRATGHRFGAVLGPGAMRAVVLLWMLWQGTGWALLYLSHVPEGFLYSSGMEPARYNDFAEALYVSLVVLATPGSGDVVATDPWVRLAPRSRWLSAECWKSWPPQCTGPGSIAPSTPRPDYFQETDPDLSPARPRRRDDGIRSL